MIKINPNEKVILEIRRHWLIMLVHAFALFLAALIPLGAIFISEYFDFFLQDSEYWDVFMFFSSIWWFALWAAFFVAWTNYYLDYWIITNERIIDVEQYGFFRRDVSEFRLDRIQDVTVEVKGLLPTLLHFGNLHVETAGEGSRQFIISHIHNPYEVKDIIFKHHNQSVEGTGQ